MPTKHCCNQTIKTVKSHVYPWGTERMINEAGGVGIFKVNNPNYLSFIDLVGTPVVYFGADHLPCGTQQVNTPA